MTEYSAIVVVQTNQADQPINLLALSEGDTISDEVLSRNIRDAASGVNEVSSTVYNNSGAWELGLDEATRRDIESVSGTVRDTSGDYTEASVGFRIFSGDIQASTSYVSGYIDDNRAAWEAGLDEATRRDIESVSGTVRDTSGDLTEASVGFRTFSGDIQASTSYVSGYIDDNRAAWEAGLDADTRADIESVSGTVRDTSGDYTEASVGFRIFSGDIQASTSYVSGYVDDLETSARNLSGLVDSSTATLDGRVDDLDASTDRLFVFSGSVETSTADIDGVVTINSSRSITNQNRITNLETSTNRLFEFSGGVETSTATLDSRTDDLDASTDRLFTFSGSVETSTADLSADLQASSDKLVTFTTNNSNLIVINAADIFVLELSTNRLFVFSGDVETSTTTLDGSVVALNASSDRLFTFSGDVETSTADLREAVDTPTSSIASGFGFVPDAPTKTLDSVAISGFGDGDTSGVSVFDG
jgi:environmental stress-induced protein Ves